MSSLRDVDEPRALTLTLTTAFILYPELEADGWTIVAADPNPVTNTR